MRSSQFQRSYPIGDEVFTATLFVGLDSAWQRCEEELLASGVPVPLPHRSAWARSNGTADPWFLSVTDRAGACKCGFGAVVKPSRALPGHGIVRVERFGSSAMPAARAVALRALFDAVRQRPRILQAHLEVFSREEAIREEIGQAAEELGFRRQVPGRSYRRTVALDLRPEEDEIFMSLHGTGRRHIRAVNKNPTAIRCVDDRSLAPRMEALMRETLARTGGTYQDESWEDLIDFATEHPELCRIVGLFRTDTSGPEALLAFAVGYAQGDNVQYRYAASTRQTDLRMPLGYAPAWDLICWGKRLGAEWFDFGGITGGSYDDEEDPLGGVSDFKRYFTKDVVRVGEEWVLDARPVRSVMARVVRAGAGLVRAVQRHT